MAKVEATTAPILATDRLIKSFGGLVATDNLTLGVLPGEIHALIGPNGAGKSTAVAQLAGQIRPSAGRILFEGRDITKLNAVKCVFDKKCRHRLSAR